MSDTPNPEDLAAGREDEVRMRAYPIWVEEGQPEGRALNHWLRAKRELEIESGRESDGIQGDHDFGPE